MSTKHSLYSLIQKHQRGHSFSALSSSLNLVYLTSL